MFRAAVGHSGDIDLDAALQTIFGECDATLDGARARARTGIILGSWDMDRQALVDAVVEHYPGIEGLSDGFIFEPRGAVDLKGKGARQTCSLVGRRGSG